MIFAKWPNIRTVFWATVIRKPALRHIGMCLFEPRVIYILLLLCIFQHLSADLLLTDLSSPVFYRSLLTISLVSWPVTTSYFGHPGYCFHRTNLLYCLKHGQGVWGFTLREVMKWILMKLWATIKACMHGKHHAHQMIYRCRPEYLQPVHWPMVWLRLKQLWVMNTCLSNV